MSDLSILRQKSCHAIPLLVILVTTVIYTWPLISQLSYAIPGEPNLTDATETIWAVGWIHQAIQTGENVWYTDRLFHPFGADLRFNVFGFFQGLIAVPFVPLLGVIGASNLIIILFIFMNGVFAYFLIYYHTSHSGSSLLASICCMLSMTVIWHFGVGRNGLPSLWIVSASLLCLANLLDRPALWKGVPLGVIFLIALFTDLHVVAFTVLWNFLYLICFVWRNGTSAFFSGSRIFPLICSLSIFAIVFYAFLAQALPSVKGNEIAPPSLDNASYYSFSLRQFVLLDYIPYIYGFDFLIGAILAPIILRHDDYRFWIFASLFFLVLSLGPYLNPSRFPLPYSLISFWPPLQNFRAAYRFVIPATLGLTVVLGYVLKELLTKVGHSGLLIGIFFTAVIFRIGYTISLEPFSTQIYPHYEIYDLLAEDVEDYTIIEIPFGIRSGLDQIGDGGERFQFYQHIHKKRVVNGSLARLPDHLFTFYRSHPALMFFSGDQTVDRDKIDDDFSTFITEVNLKYILVHESFIPSKHLEEINGFLDNHWDLRKIERENDLVVYEVIP